MDDAQDTISSDTTHDEPLQFGSDTRKLYLVRVPASLGKIWKNIEGSDVKIGQVKLGKRDSKGRRKVGKFFSIFLIK